MRNQFESILQCIIQKSIRYIDKLVLRTLKKLYVDHRTFSESSTGKQLFNRRFKKSYMKIFPPDSNESNICNYGDIIAESDILHHYCINKTYKNELKYLKYPKN